MKRWFSLFALRCLSATAQAQINPVPPLMNFQGRLAKPDGAPVADGVYSVRFSLWDAASGGTEKWSQTVSATSVRNGAFAVLLSGFPGGTFNGNLWLEIKLGTDAPLTPRQQLVSVAYAMKADSVKDGAITGASIANGTITSDKFAANAFNPLAWLLNGNSGVTSGFLGTTDNNSLAFRTNNVERLRLLPNGNVGIGTNAPGSTLDVNGTARMTGFKLPTGASANTVLASDVSGNVGIGNTTPSFKLDVNGNLHCIGFSNTSDARYKTHIAPLPDALDTILNLRGVTFDWRKDEFREMNFSGGRQVGFIAQEVEKVLPELVTIDGKGYKSVAYANVVPVLVEAVKTLKKDNDGKQKQIDILKAQNEALEAKLNALAEAVRQLQSSGK